MRTPTTGSASALPVSATAPAPTRTATEPSRSEATSSVAARRLRSSPPPRSRSRLPALATRPTAATAAIVPASTGSGHGDPPHRLDEHPAADAEQHDRVDGGRQHLAALPAERPPRAGRPRRERHRRPAPAPARTRPPPRGRRRRAARGCPTAGRRPAPRRARPARWPRARASRRRTPGPARPCGVRVRVRGHARDVRRGGRLGRWERPGVAPGTGREQSSVAQGQVAWFNAEKGFGFVTPDGGGADVFVHSSSVVDGGAACSRASRSSTRWRRASRGPQAQQVRVLGGGPAPRRTCPRPPAGRRARWRGSTTRRASASSRPTTAAPTCSCTSPRSLEDGGHRSLAEGQRVEFDVVEGDRGLQAAQRAAGRRARAPQPPTPTEGRHTATVLWFRGEKGFGFLSPDDGSPDLFVHASALVSDDGSYVGLREGDRVEYEVVPGERGPQAAQVRLLADAGPPGRPQGTVSWFDAGKGFGFITPYDGGPDLFAHFSQIAEGTGYRSLEEGAARRVRRRAGRPRAAGGRHRARSATAPRGGRRRAGPHRRHGQALRHREGLRLPVPRRRRGGRVRALDARSSTTAASAPSSRASGWSSTSCRATAVRRPPTSRRRAPPARAAPRAPCCGSTPRRASASSRPADGSADVFVHFSAIADDGGYRTLEEGQRVELDVVQGDRGPQAQDVRPL